VEVDEADLIRVKDKKSQAYSLSYIATVEANKRLYSDRQRIQTK
jgi:hypothetical protein